MKNVSRRSEQESITTEPWAYLHRADSGEYPSRQLKSGVQSCSEIPTCWQTSAAKIVGDGACCACQESCRMAISVSQSQKCTGRDDFSTIKVYHGRCTRPCNVSDKRLDQHRSSCRPVQLVSLFEFKIGHGHGGLPYVLSRNLLDGLLDR